MRASDIKPGMKFVVLTSQRVWLYSSRAGNVSQWLVPAGFTDVVIDVKPASFGVEVMLTKGYVFVSDDKLDRDIEVIPANTALHEELDRLGGIELLKRFIEAVTIE